MDPNTERDKRPTQSQPVDGNVGDTAPALVSYRLSDVPRQKIRWLWPGRLPLGKVSMIVGDPNVGKSFLTHDIAARVSCGRGWPDQPTVGDDPSKAADVLILSVEDDASDTIAPRLDALGADTRRIHVVEAVRERREGSRSTRCFTLDRDIDHLRDALDRNPYIRLIIIDPVSAYLGRRDSHNNAEVREVLAPLCALAAEKGVAVICVTHLNKGAGSPMQRIMGSIAFNAVSRATWLVARDKNDPEVRLLLPIKANLAPDGGTMGLAYKIESRGHDTMPVVTWGRAPISTTAEEALAIEPAQRGRPATQRQDAVSFLRDELSHGVRLATDVQAAAFARGISERTLDRAKEELRVHSSRTPSNGPWHWQLPADALALPSFSQAIEAA
jgi:putative DNA primase/helicase